MSQSTSEAAITPPSPIDVPARRKFRFDNRYVAPLFITDHPADRSSFLWHPRKLPKRRPWQSSVAIVTELILGRIFLWQVA